MQNTSALYQQIFKIPAHKKEICVEIAGEQYGENRIVSLTTSGGISRSRILETALPGRSTLYCGNPEQYHGKQK